MKKIILRSIALFVGLSILSYSGLSQTLKFDGISEAKPLKRGKEYSIKWSGGLNNQLIKIELHNATGKVQSWEGIQNDGEQVVKLNPHLKPGISYSFKIFAGVDIVSSQNVAIKRKVPLALTLSALVAVPTILILLENKNEAPGILKPPTTPIP